MKLNPLIAAACIAMATAPSVMAADYPTNAFDAKYDLSSAAGKSELRMASNGAGKFLTATSAAGATYTTLVDYQKKTSTTLIEQGKMAMQSVLPDNGSYVSDENSVKKAGGKSIGTKVIKGHPCHGYAYTNPSGKSEVWIGDDVKVVVESTTTSPAGKTMMSLKSIAGAPPATAFQVPAGYKLMKQ